MPIDIAKVAGADLGEFESSWTEDDVILYHLGLGAGDPPTAERELAYTYEAALKVLPTFATIPSFPAMLRVATLDGMDVNPMLILHGEHEIVLARRIPTSATVRSSSRITGVYDKGKAALVAVESVSSDRAGTLFINRASLYLRGEGGFSPEAPHEQGPQPTTPPRSPNKVVELVTLPQQALLYRLSGDKNPLHADPQMAALAGFDRPILHGLCSFGIACKAVVDAMLDGEPDRVTAYSARFAGVAFPGETLVVSMWTQPNEILLVASTKERSSPVLVNGLIRLAV